jgi:branched-chain amino acid transport system substrate-binding protein
MKRILFTLLLTTALFTAFACERRGGTSGGSDTGPIKVGVYADLSGQTSSFGQSTVNGIKMAADEINKAGGIGGRQVELLIEDDQGRPEQAATVVTKLISQNQVNAVLGEVASSNSLAAAPKAQAAKVPMITPSSTNPKVTQVGDYIFRVCFIDPFQGEVMAKFGANTLKAKRAAILLDVNSDYSRGLAQFFEENFVKLGGQIVERQSYTQTDRDFKGQLTSIRSANPEIIYVPGYYGQVGVIAKQAKELGIKAPLLGGDGWDAPQLFQIGGAALNGSYMSNHYSVDDPSPSTQKFVADYKARYNGTQPDAIGALAYDAMKVLADAIRRAGTTESTKLRDAIAQTQNYQGVTGNISLNNERNAVKPAVVFELRDGKYVYKETIQPEGAQPTTPAATTTNTTPTTGTSPASTNTTSSSNVTTTTTATTAANSNTSPATTNTSGTPKSKTP